MTTTPQSLIFISHPDAQGSCWPSTFDTRQQWEAWSKKTGITEADGILKPWSL